MSDFANTLSAILKENRLSINRVSAESGIDRTVLSKGLKGSRPIPFYSFKKLINSIAISSADKNLLVQKFIKENFGLEKFNNYTKILKKFSEIEKEPDSPDSYNLKIDIRIENGIMELHSKSEIITAAHHIISLEAQKESGRVYSNFPTSIMVELMRSFPDCPLDFKYIIDNLFNKNAKLPNLSDVFDLMTLGYSCNYTMSSGNEYHINFIFPHFLITNDSLLLMDPYANKGFITRNKSVIKQYTDIFLEKFADTKPYIEKFDNILSLKEQNANIFDTINITKGTFLCPIGCAVTHFLTLDMWDQIAKPDIPNRDFLRDTTYQYYQKTYAAIRKNQCQLSTRESLSDFVDNGIVESMPREFAYPLAKKNRIIVLEKMYEEFLNDNCQIYFINSNKCRFCQGFGIEIIEGEKNSACMQVYFQTENCMLHYCGNMNMFIDDSITTREFLKFIGTFIASDYCYSKEKSLEILREEILRCKMLPE